MSETNPFSFSPGASGASDKTREPMGANQGGVASVPNDPAIAQAREAIDSARKRRGRRSKEEIDAEEQARRARFEQEYATLFEPKQWGAICRSPADLMLHMTGRKLWEVEERELEPLAVGAAHTARMFLQTDPKWVALTMFAISLTQIYGTRIAIHISQMRTERAAALKSQQKPQATT